MNSLTGASSSAKQGYQYSKELAAQQWRYQKEAMQNQIQWRMQDMAEAGLNPALAAENIGGGSGNSPGGGTVNGGGAGGLGILGEIAGIYNGTRDTDAKTANLDTETKLAPQKVHNENLMAQAALKNADAAQTNAKTNQKLGQTGLGGKILGMDSNYTGLVNTIAAAAPGVGLIGGARKVAELGRTAYRAWKNKKAFGAFLKSVGGK